VALDRRTQRSQPRAVDGTARKTRRRETRDKDAALLMMVAIDDRARSRWEND
jgi:hypothetical protein